MKVVNMELCLYTDSLAEMAFEQALDAAVSIGASAVEIAAGGQSSAPHMDLFELLADEGKRADFAAQISGRGLRLAAINCSAWPMHPKLGDEHLRIMRGAVELAELLGVEKIVTMSGCPGDSPAGNTFNWIWHPWPPDAVEIRDRQWEQAFDFWRDFSSYATSHGVKQVALELHGFHLVHNVPTLMRLREEVGPVLGANVDPSHMFWQGMDTVRAVEALGDSIYHVHLKDVEFNDSALALTGVLDAAPLEDPNLRSWIFRTVGRGHGSEFWGSFVEALQKVGYTDVLSIENEDPVQGAEEGVREAAAFINPFIQQNGAVMAP